MVAVILFFGTALQVPKQIIPPAPVVQPKPETFKIGAILSLSGKFHEQGWSMLHGYRLAIDAINTRKPIQTHDAELLLTLVVFDDESSPQRTVEVTRALLEDSEVRVLLAPYSSLLASPAAAVAKAKGIPVLVAVGSTAGLRSVAGENVYALQTPPSKHLADAAQLLVTQLAEADKVPENFKIILVAAADPHSQEVVAGAARILRAASAGIVATVILFPPAIPLSEDAVNTIIEADALFIAGYAHSAELVVSILAKNETWPSFLAMTHCDLANFSTGGPAPAEGALCALHWQASAKLPDSKPLQSSTFVSDYLQIRGEPPPHQAVAAAAAVLVVAEALREFGNRSSESFSAKLSATDLNTFYGDVNFDKNGVNDAKPMVLSQIQNSRLIPVGPDSWAVAKYLPKPAKKKNKKTKKKKKTNQKK